MRDRRDEEHHRSRERDGAAGQLRRGPLAGADVDDRVPAQRAEAEQDDRGGDHRGRRRRAAPARRASPPTGARRARSRRAFARAACRPPGRRPAPHEPRDHRRDVDREEGRRGGERREPGRADRGHGVGEDRLQDDDVESGDDEEPQHPRRAQDAAEGTLVARATAIRPPRAQREDGAGDAHRGGDGEGKLDAAERTSSGIVSGGDRPAERYRRLADAERPAAPRGRVGAEERAGARDRDHRGADPGDDERDEQELLRVGRLAADEPGRAEHRACEDRALDPEPVDGDARADQRETGAEQAAVSTAPSSGRLSP